MKHSNFVDRDSRRNALKGMAVLSGAAVVSTVTSASAADIAGQKVQSEAPPTLGYRKTDHIREYYRTCRF